MATASLSDEALLAFFHSHPNLRDRVISILGAVENSNGDLGEADAAEERLVEEMRLFGREALQGWADKRIEATGRVCLAIEISPAYCDVVLERWQAMTGQPAVLDGEDRTFADITEARRPNVAA